MRKYCDRSGEQFVFKLNGGKVVKGERSPSGELAVTLKGNQEVLIYFKSAQKGSTNGRDHRRQKKEYSR